MPSALEGLLFYAILPDKEDVAVLNDWFPLAAFALVVGLVGASLVFRARAMRAFAARSGFQYVGPPAPKWLGIPKIKPQLPISRTLYPGSEIWQVWNVIEGEEQGVQVLIFDSLLSTGSWAYCTFIACRMESNPFEKEDGERVVKSRDWRVLCGNTNPFTPWTMSVSHVERHLKDLRSYRCSGPGVDDSGSLPIFGLRPPDT